MSSRLVGGVWSLESLNHHSSRITHHASPITHHASLFCPDTGDVMAGFELHERWPCGFALCDCNRASSVEPAAGNLLGLRREISFESGAYVAGPDSRDRNSRQQGLSIRM